LADTGYNKHLDWWLMNGMKMKKDWVKEASEKKIAAVFRKVMIV